MSISPSNDLSSGSSTAITAILSAPAPPAGAQIILSDNNTAYPVPNSITVPAGSLSASAVVETGAVSTSTPVTITGVYNGTQTTALTVEYENAQTTATAATTVTGDSAVLNGSINPNLAHGTVMFWWGTDPTMNNYNLSCSGSNCPLVAPNSTSQAFSYSLTGLSNSTSYYFRMVFYDSDTGYYQYGAILSSITVQGPIVTTTSAASIGSSGATLNGTVNPLGANGYTEFQWGTDPTMNSYNQACWPTALAPNSAVQPFSCAISDLSSLTVYYFRLAAYDTDTGIWQYGLIQTFTTIDAVAATSAATAITSYSATLNGTVNPEGSSGYAIFEFGKDSTFGTYQQTTYLSITANTTAQAISLSTTTSYNYVPLNSGTTYYFRLVFNNQSNGETKYGPVQQFKTLILPAVTVTTSSPSITTAQPLVLTASVSEGTGNPAPTGSVVLTGGGYTSAAISLSNGSAKITIPAGSLAAGTDTLTVSYSGDGNYTSGLGIASVTVSTTAQAVLVSPTPASTLPGSSVLFTWSAATAATDYEQFLGSTGKGSYDLYY